MSKIRKEWGVSLVILAFSMNANAQTCGTPPSCESLGYTQTVTDCGSDTKALKCPLDLSKMFCASNLIPATNCETGDILYYDSSTNIKSCSRSMLTKKTAIGVVFSKEERLAVALTNAGSQMAWGGYGTDIPTLASCSSGTQLTCGVDGKANTSAIIAYGKANGISYPAAEYCASYNTSGTEAGDWFLPSLADLQSIYNAKNYVNASLQLLGKPALSTDDYYWSSTELNNYDSWKLDVNNGSVGYYGKKGSSYYVRAVVAF